MSSAVTGPADTKPNGESVREPIAIPTEQECEDVRDQIQDIIDDKHKAKGLAIVIGSSNAPGACDDAKNIKSTFEKLGFAVFAKEKGASLNAICRIVQAVAKYCKYKECHKCFAFYYAGHGGSEDGHGYIKHKAGERLYITEGIVDLFTPEAKCTDVYRLFFFDCCLSDGSRDNAVIKKRPLGNLPAGANMLVAYATSMEHKSKGYDGLGGTWTSVLHENLLQDLPITTILDITCDQVIDKCIIDKGNQAPHYISSVGILCLKSWIFTWDEYWIEKHGGQLPVPGANHDGNDDQDEGENRSVEDPSNSKLTKNRKRKQYQDSDSHPVPKIKKQEQQSEQTQNYSNPTQNTASIINEAPPLIKAYNFLKEKSANWEDIAKALDSASGNDTTNLRIGLHHNSSLTNEGRLEGILNTWLEQGYPFSTWDQLMKALNELGYKGIVAKIKKFLRIN